jgi:hypothetical protein
MSYDSMLHSQIIQESEHIEVALNCLLKNDQLLKEFNKVVKLK